MRKSALFSFGLVVTALVALGLVILSSASEANALKITSGADPYFYMKRQFLYLGAGLVTAVLASIFDYRCWRDRPFLAWLFFGGVFLALFAVFPQLGGRAVKGSYRWINLGLFNLQPSEFAKLAIVIMLGVWLDSSGWRVEMFRTGALYPFLMITLLAAPILLEPDFGSVMVVGMVGVLLMFVAGTRLLHMVPFLGLGLAVVGYKLFTNENRMRRLGGFFNNDFFRSLAGGAAADAVPVATNAAASAGAPMDAAAYQSYNSLVAIKNGGLWGVGLGESLQKHYYLPEAHTDFIFAVGAEELGLVFSVSVMILFVAFFALSVYIARRASDRFGRFLVIGMAFIIFFQAMFNLGVVCEALPTKGMALPFFSYGGTNMISAFFAVGTILSVGIHSYRDSKRKLKRSVFV